MTERLDIQVIGHASGQYRFVLRDALGRVVAAAPVVSGGAALRTSGLPAGGYVWSLEGVNGVVRSGRVVRQ
jgi:hypothetical protein